MNKELLIYIGSLLSHVRIYPLFDICHYLLTALQVRDDIQQYQTGIPNFTRRHPFSCWLSTILLCFSGSILTNFLLGESPIKDFIHYQYLLLATICWYIVFYFPFDLVNHLIRFIPFRLVIGVGKEIYRTRKIYDGVRLTLALYPDGYIIVVLIGAIKGCGETIMSSIDRFIRGVWLPTQHEFLFPSFATKACFLSSLIFLLHRMQLIKFEYELIYLCVVSTFVYVRLITSFFKQYDPFMPFENLSSGLLFSSWIETISEAYRRATATNNGTTQVLAISSSGLSSSASSGALVNVKKDGISNDGQNKANEYAFSHFFLLISFVAARVKAEICRNMSQYSRCSTNKACACLRMEGTKDIGVCAYQWESCSQLKTCEHPNNNCHETNHICVHHPQCSHLPVCYPKSMTDIQICPPQSECGPSGVTVARTNGVLPNGTSPPWQKWTVWVMDDKTVLINDYWNHRILQWKTTGDVTDGQVVAGDHGMGSHSTQLKNPATILYDKKTDSIIICDRGNLRVVRWYLKNNEQGEILIPRISCYGLAMDDQRNLYVSDIAKEEVRKYEMDKNDTKGVCVAGGNGKGNGLNQFNMSEYIFVDANQAVYVSDYYNHRVMKWEKGATEGIVVAGGSRGGTPLEFLMGPTGIYVDSEYNVYVTELGNHRVTRWAKGAKKGVLVVGGNGRGNEVDQLSGPTSIFFDNDGNLYVADSLNSRIQRFSCKSI